MIYVNKFTCNLIVRKSYKLVMNVLYDSRGLASTSEYWYKYTKK